MNIRGNAVLREMLAAEYALGTLRGGARRRFEGWLRTDGELRTLAFAWSERLAPLLDGVAPATPPQRVWDAIEARLPGAAARGDRAPAASGWWNRLALWRGLSATFATLAVAAVAFALRPVVQPEPRIVMAEPRLIPAEPTIVQAPPKIIQLEPKAIQPVPKVVPVDTMPVAVAMLVDAKSGKPVAVVMEPRSGDALYVKVADDVVVGEGKELQLWMAPQEGDGMQSMGMLPAGARGEPVRVAAAGAGALDRAKAFGLSLEPAGGSPQPTQVLGLGPLIRLTPG